MGQLLMVLLIIFIYIFGDFIVFNNSSINKFKLYYFINILLKEQQQKIKSFYLGILKTIKKKISLLKILLFSFFNS